MVMARKRSFPLVCLEFFRESHYHIMKAESAARAGFAEEKEP